MKKAWKPVLYVFGGLIALVAAALASIQVILDSDYLREKIDAFAEQYIDGTLSYGKITASVVKSFPNLNVTLQDVSITYPHDMFERFDSTGAPGILLAMGRGAQTDTLAYFSDLSASVNYVSLISGDIDIPKVSLRRPRIYAHSYDSTVANWNIIRLETDPDDTTSFKLPGMKLGGVRIEDRPRVFYTSQADTLYAAILFDRLNLKGDLGKMDVSLRLDSMQVSGRYKADTLLAAVDFLDMRAHDGHFHIDADASADINTRDFGRMNIPFGLNTRFSVPEPEDDATICLDFASISGQIAGMPLDAQGNLKMYQDSIWVDFAGKIAGFELHRVIEDYGNRFVDDDLMRYGINSVMDLDFTAVGAIAGNELPVVHTDVKEFNFKMKGIDAMVRGSIDDLLGEDPLVYFEECRGKLDVHKVMAVLQDDESINARGTLDASIKGKFLLSQLDLYSFTSTSLNGYLKGDDIMVDIPADSISFYASNPYLTLEESEDNAGHLGLDLDLDSLYASVGSSIRVRAKEVCGRLTNSENVIEGGLRPLDADLDASVFELVLPDSISVSLKDTYNCFSIVKENGLPHLNLTSNTGALGGSLVQGSAEAYDVLLSLDARKRVESSRNRNLLRERVLNRDVPDYLSEQDFRKADISINLSETIMEYLRSWNPSGSIKIGAADVRTPVLPLQNSLANLDGDFTDDGIFLRNLDVTSGTSSLSAHGDLSGLRRVMRSGGRSRGRNNVVNLDFKVDAERINANELLAAYRLGKESMLTGRKVTQKDIVQEMNDTTSSKKMGVLVIPANLVMDVDLEARRLDWSDLVVNHMFSCIRAQERCLQITDTEFRTNMGDIFLDAFYSTINKNDISAGVDLRMEEITADDVIHLIPQVDTIVPLLKSFKGKLNCDFAVTTQIDTNMNLVLPSLEGIVKIAGKDLKMTDIGSLKRFTRLLMFKDRANINIDDMSVCGLISNNELEVFPFILGVDRYTLGLAGVQNFNQNFQYHVSLIESPLLMKMGVNFTGNFSDWKMKLGKAHFRSTKLPLFNEQVDGMQVNLANSIRNIYNKGVDAAIKEHSAAATEAAKATEEFKLTEEELDAEEVTELTGPGLIAVQDTLKPLETKKLRRNK